MKYTHSWHVLQVGQAFSKQTVSSGRPPGLAQIAIRDLLKGPAFESCSPPIPVSAKLPTCDPSVEPLNVSSESGHRTIRLWTSGTS
jgi:hypothetical protein